MYAPRATPREVIDAIHKEIVRIIALPDTRERLTQLGADPVASSPEEFAAFTRAELEKFAKIVKQAGIQPE
jgi:tripartite-type tricarboxylate transporter receptor subunit TctC